MLHGRRLSRRLLLTASLWTALPGLIWGFLVYVMVLWGQGTAVAIPWLPVSVVGIAVAFYVGFKNNSAYDRFWEGRKIWGAVVNESRSWASGVLNYVRPGDESPEAVAVRRTLVYRHLAWINALRLQLRGESRFFEKPARATKRRLDRHAEHMRNDWEAEVGPFLSEAEHRELRPMVNTATHLVHRQGEQLASLHAEGGLDLFKQLTLMNILRELYTLQGKAERIKKTPFPRQYAEYSRVFTWAYVLLMPFGLLDIFEGRVPDGIPQGPEVVGLLAYLVAAGAISWVFLTMEGIGSSSEDPFERSFNDVPMNALCRVIERDLRQLLGETELPPPEQPVDGILY